MFRKNLLCLTALAFVLGVSLTAFAWHEKEHHAVTALSARLLAEDKVPAWFLAGIPTDAAECSIDPDNFKNRALPQLDASEGPDHYLDIEPLDALGVEMPAKRLDYYKLCYANKLDPAKLGMLPWTVAEWQQRLTIAFAEHRKWPNNPTIQRKCLVYAGLMAHYAGDLCMPLHTTIHHDGKVADFNAKSPRTGIHAKIDGLFRSFDYDPAVVMKGAQAQSFDDLWSAIWTEFRKSHALVDRAYELADKLPARNARIEDPQVIDFATERMRSSASFIASLYLTAWNKSADIKLPDWLDRDALTLPH